MYASPLMLAVDDTERQGASLHQGTEYRRARALKTVSAFAEV